MVDGSAYKIGLKLKHQRNIFLAAAYSDPTSQDHLAERKEREGRGETERELEKVRCKEISIYPLTHLLTYLHKCISMHTHPTHIYRYNMCI